MFIETNLNYFRKKTSTQILYIIVFDEDGNFNPFFKSVVKAEALMKVRELPKDILVLNDSLRYFSTNINMTVKAGYNLLFVPESSLTIEGERNLINMMSLLYDISNEIIVFLIDENCRQLDLLLQNICNFNSLFFYYTTYNKKTGPCEYLQNNYFNDSSELISYFKRDLDKIRLMLVRKTGNVDYLNFTINIEDEFHVENINVNTFSDFIPSMANFFTLNQIICNYWIKPNVPIESNRELASEKELGSTNRGDIILKKAHLIDYITSEIKSNIKPITIVDPAFEPLILIAPYHNPRWKGLVNEFLKSNTIYKKHLNNFYSVLTSEQNLDYFNIIEGGNTKIDLATITSIMEILNDRYILLDCLAYLHASFANSPVIRLPAIGKSINKELSYFKPELHNFFKHEADSFKSIQKFGIKLKKLLISEKVEEYIKNRNRQIIVISDLPVEWLIIDNAPLSFTHDICRIPEFRYMGLMNQYSLNDKFEFKITSNILKRTLVIHGASADPNVDKPMKEWFPYVAKFSKELGFTHIHCKTLDEVVKAVSSFKPELLIFDCHGGTDVDTLSSYLMINDEKMTSEFIINNSIGAPIVFLSACNTAPTYGYINSIADAFFQVGSLTVTSTFLPIYVYKGSILFIRLLVQLSQATKKVFHRNWLDFIGHINRTSVIQETFFKAVDSLDDIDENFDKKLAELMTESMKFHERNLIYNNLLNGNITLNKKVNITLRNIKSDFLLYSQLGRADLIYFENWLQANIEANFDKV